MVTCTYKNRQQPGDRGDEDTKVRGRWTGRPSAPRRDLQGQASRVGDCLRGDREQRKVCFDGLPFGTYTVREVVPAGYSLADPPGNDRSVTVDNNTNCSVSPFAAKTVSFWNTPLTDMDVNAAAQDPGATKSDITCVDENDVDVGNSGGFNDPAHADADDLPPGTYTCTVVVDP